ncbi:MAG TPA: sugar ABC transporter substrate-binding protein [Spirochaetales bacterium]|nr:sugar ABC transporter substrate-binding protein [Spirochaetales bacterium]
MKFNRLHWWILSIVVFAVALAGALAFNVALVNRSRTALASTVLRNPADIKTARFHLVAILPDTTDPFFAQLEDALREEAEHQNAALQVFLFPQVVAGEEGTTLAEIRRWFDIAMRSKVDGIVLFRSAGLDIRDMAEEAAAANIPFVPVAIDEPKSWKYSSVAGDSGRQGKEAGTLALGLLGASARIGVILSADTSQGFSYDEEPFYRGVEEATRAKPGTRIVAAVREEESILGGEDACARMLADHPDINAILCIDAKATIGAAQVIIDRGVVGQIVIIGSDENDEVKRLIEKGVVHASIVRDAAMMGKVSVALAIGQRTGMRGQERISVGFKIIPQRGGEL